MAGIAVNDAEANLQQFNSVSIVIADNDKRTRRVEALADVGTRASGESGASGSGGRVMAARMLRQPPARGQMQIAGVAERPGPVGVIRAGRDRRGLLPSGQPVRGQRLP